MWIGRLSLDFEQSGGKTIIRRRRHEGPLLIQRPFYEPDGTCHVYLLHPPGGVVGGDRLMYRFDCRDGARALATTPGATKLYRSPSQYAHLTHELDASGRSSFEWLPQETIVFGGAKADVSTQIRLDAGAQFIGWDITCLGHDNQGLPHGDLTQDWHVERSGHTLWRERARVQGGALALSAAWGLAGRTVFGTLIATGARAADVDAVREVCPDADRDWLGVTLLGEILLCRYLGYSAEAAKRCFGAAWVVLRQRVLGREARPPRVWAT